MLQKVHLLAEKIIMLSPEFVPFSMGNAEALKALEDWKKQQKQSDFTGPVLPSASHFSDFPNSLFFFFFPQAAVLYTKLDCLQIQKPLNTFFH